MSDQARALQAGFLDGPIVANYLPTTPAEGSIGGPMYAWSTPVCRGVSRVLCTSIFCPSPGPITRDPIDCPPPPINK